MNEFDVKRRLAQRSEKVNSDSASQMTNGIPNSVLADVFAGKQKASSEMMGHRSNLAPSIAAKMSQSFGMDVSGVQIYRSDAMAGSTMHGMAQGNKVVLSSDVDLNTLEGQAVLGHELSHVRAQGMGIGTGNGLLSDAGLEHQADTEGMLAARGMSIGGESLGMSMGLGMAGLEGLQPIGAGMGASAAAPMQAEKFDDVPDVLVENPNQKFDGQLPFDYNMFADMDKKAQKNPKYIEALKKDQDDFNKEIDGAHDFGLSDILKNKFRVEDTDYIEQFVSDDTEAKKGMDALIGAEDLSIGSNTDDSNFGEDFGFLAPKSKPGSDADNGVWTMDDILADPMEFDERGQDGFEKDFDQNVNLHFVPDEDMIYMMEKRIRIKRAIEAKKAANRAKK